MELMRNKTGYSLKWILHRLSIGWSTYHKWLKRKPVQKKCFVHPLKALPCEEAAVIEYAKNNGGTGYKKLTYQMLDADVVALTAAQVYRILNGHDLLDKWGTVKGGTAKEYKHKPTRPDEHWHTDIMYIKVLGMWCFLIAVLDGYSRYIVDWKVMLDMTSRSVSLFMQEVIDKNSPNGVMLINDNGSQPISNDFKKVLMAGNIQQCRIRRNHPR